MRLTLLILTSIILIPELKQVWESLKKLFGYNDD